MKIYIDVSNILSIKFLTGIQRVVIEVVTRLLKNSSLNIVLFSWPSTNEKLSIISNKDFLNNFDGKSKSKKTISIINEIDISDICSGDVFFDIDAVWNPSNHTSAQVYSQLKGNNVKIVTYVYDLIPLKYPMYAHSTTLFNFMKYAVSVFTYADKVIVSTQAVLDDIAGFCKKLNIPKIAGSVSWLGSDFSAKNVDEKNVSEIAKTIVNKGKYILMVGTIEPRKNHKLVLDAYEKKLKNLGINVVFAGKIGWNVDELIERIKNHPDNEKNIFHLQGQNDATINFLYENAYLVAFPTYDEGFGLPMVEAFQRKSVIIASDVPVIREVGKDYCDYFNPDSVDEFCALVENYIKEPYLYAQRKKKLDLYVPITWDDVALRISNDLMAFDIKKNYEVKKAKQIVILTARSNDFLSTIPFIEKFMGFIREIVVCCPDKIVDEINNNYDGILPITFLTDNEILNGKALPEDHQTRNFYLRCLAIQNPKIEDVFIMSDDDYRPLDNIDYDYFEVNGKYNAYYCYDLEKWQGCPWGLTSFDIGMKKSLKFCKENGYTSKMYASHCPQIIDKRIFIEMLNVHKNIELSGISEWESYFNFAISKYPYLFNNKIFETMTWPGSFYDWKLQYKPAKFSFENYYESSYAKNGIFKGLSETCSKNIETDNLVKIKNYSNSLKNFSLYQEFFEIFSQKYKEITLSELAFTCIYGEVNFLLLPKYLILLKSGFINIPFEFRNTSNNVNNSINIEYYSIFKNDEGKALGGGCDKVNFTCINGSVINVPLFLPNNYTGRCKLYFKIKINDYICEKSMNVSIIDSRISEKNIEKIIMKEISIFNINKGKKSFKLHLISFIKKRKWLYKICIFMYKLYINK